MAPQGGRNPKKSRRSKNSTELEWSDRKDLRHSRVWSTKPKELERRYMRMEWSTESKVVLTSKRARKQTGHGQ